MTNNPLISVVIPLYNKEISILNTMYSVLNQTFRDFEVVVVNDGSTDKSAEVINSLHDNRIRVLTKENKGVSSARNYGVENSRGNFVFFLDADDIISEDCLEEFSILIGKYPSVEVFVSNFKIVQPDKSELVISQGKKERLIKKPLKHQWHRKVYPRTGSMLIHRSCFQKIGFFHPKINIFEDLEFTIRLFKFYKVVYTPKILMSYELTFSQQSKKIQDLSNEFAYYIDLNTNDFYEKLILSQNVYCAYMNRRRIGDENSKDYLLKKNKKNIAFIIFAMIYKKTVDLIVNKGF